MAADGRESARSLRTDDAKAYLRRLAGLDGAAVVDRAEAATADLERAATFVDEGGLVELERTVEATDDPDVQARGERALSAFRRFRTAAVGDSPADHFHRGHDTDLRDAVEGSRQ